MKRFVKWMCCFMIFAFLFTGCGKEETAESVQECTLKEEPAEPVEESTLIGEDFQLTIRSERSWYKEKQFLDDVQFTLELEYIGDEEEVTIWHADPLAFIGISTQEGEYVFDVGVWNMVRAKTVLKKGEPYQVELKGDELGELLKILEEAGGAAFSDGELEEGYTGDVFKNGSLIKGKYQAVAYVLFYYASEEMQEEEEYHLTLPVNFEIR